MKHNTFCLPSLVFICISEGLPSENRKSPRSSKCLLRSAGGIVDEGFCLTQTKSWPPTAIPTIMCVPYVWMNLPNKIDQYPYKTATQGQAWPNVPHDFRTNKNISQTSQPHIWNTQIPFSPPPLHFSPPLPNTDTKTGKSNRKKRISKQVKSN